MITPTTYYQIRYPDMTVSRTHGNFEFTSMDAIEEALKHIMYCPIGTSIFFSDTPHSGEKVERDEYCFEVEKLSELQTSIWEYAGEKSTFISMRDLPKHFRRCSK